MFEPLEDVSDFEDAATADAAVAEPTGEGDMAGELHIDGLMDHESMNDPQAWKDAGDRARVEELSKQAGSIGTGWWDKDYHDYGKPLEVPASVTAKDDGDVLYEDAQGNVIKDQADKAKAKVVEEGDGEKGKMMDVIGED